jgi:translocation and assembly module TamA
VLFFSGGGGSVRGFEYQANGVVLPSGQEVGGRSLIEASTELRAKLSENFGVVGFIDGAIVGSNATPDFTAEIDVGVGVGVRWRTGLGPLRIDVARAINRKQGDPVVGVYIGLGQAF